MLEYVIPGRRLALALVMGCFALVVEASAPMTLQTAIQKTLGQNPQLHQFTFTQLKLQAQRESTTLKPAYNLGLEVENFAGSGEMEGADSAEITVALSSVIELGDKQQSRTAVAEARLNRFSLEQQAQTLDVLGALTRAFVHLLATQAEIQLSEEALILSKELLSAVSDRARRGAASDAEVMRTRAMLTQSTIHRDNLRRRFEREQITLIRFWGETSPHFGSVEGELFAFGPSQSFDQLYDRVRASPAMAIFASDLRLRDVEVRLAQTQSRADLSWQLGVRHFEETNDTGLTLGVSIPLFSSSRSRSSVNAALAERNAAEYQQADRSLLLHGQLFNAFSQRQQFIASHDQLRQQVIPQLEEALRITRKAYDRGALSFQDWVAAQRELLTAKQQRIEAATAALINQATIEQLTAEPLTTSR
ncbi:TolC family protein [Zhongshania aliphaticivorans]|uniref:TolC family protein n=1 Tax=Zhongshania aliphaticivorans TaxID=1470434 RepID=UPI0039C9B6D5